MKCIRSEHLPLQKVAQKEQDEIVWKLSEAFLHIWVALQRLSRALQRLSRACHTSLKELGISWVASEAPAAKSILTNLELHKLMLGMPFPRHI